MPIPDFDWFARARSAFTGKGAFLWGLVITQFLIAAWLFFAFAAAGGGGASFSWPIAAGVGAFLAVTVAATFVVLRVHRTAREKIGLLGRAFEALPQPLMIIGPRGETLFANPAARKAFHVGRKEPYEAVLTHLSRDGGAAPVVARLKAAAESGEVDQAEIRIPGPDGDDEWRHVSVSPVEGQPGYAVWRIEDITERRRMEDLIHKEQEALFEFVEQAPVGFYSVDVRGRFCLVNRKLADWLGSTPEEMISENFHLHDFVVSPLPKGTAPYEPSATPKKHESGYGVIAEHDHVKLCGRQGRVLQVQISQNVVSDSDGEIFTRSVVHDVTQEHNLERALRQSLLRFEKFFKAAPGGIAQLDLDGRIVECNRALCKLLDEEGNDVTLRLFRDLVGEEDRAKAESLLADIINGGDMGGPVELTLPTSDESGSLRVGSFFASRMEDDKGELSGLILHGLDMTEQKQLEVQFSQSQKMQALGQLAGGVAHDFNNLLTAMIGFCDLLLLRHRPGEQSFVDVMQIKQNANRAANLVRQLLAFSRQQTVRPEVLDVTEVLVELSHLLRRLIGENIELKLTHGRDLGRVMIDQGQFEQVIVNMAVNARDAMSEGGTLMIRTENVVRNAPVRTRSEVMPAGEYVLIEVSDTGMGIEKALVERVFDPFFSTKEVGSGTGLGLSTVHGIIKQAEGFVYIDSAAGKGTKFSIYLPCYQGDERAEAGEVGAGEAAGEAAGVRDLTGIGTVLLVEDEDAVRLFSARALRTKGYKVLEARSGNTAIEIINRTSEPIDLLITDIVMPDMNGPELIAWIQDHHPEMKVICISGYAEESFRKHLDRAADIHFLPKPFSLNQLAGKVKEVMQAAA